MADFQCQCCGACCRWPGVVHATEGEMAAAAEHLGVTLDTFIQSYTELSPDRRELVYASGADGACIFLGEDNLCRIYPVRPEQCRTYPKNWDVPPSYQRLCAGRNRQLAAMKEPIGFVHVLGHPAKPMDVVAFPADAQVLNCRNMCLMLEHLGVPYAYYGCAGSVIPGPCGRLVDCGKPTGPWKYGNRWHQLYNRRLSRHLAKEARKDGRPELVLSMYGAAQADIDAQELPVIEPMVGYDHCWAEYRVFPSYSQQSVIYAMQHEQTRSSRFFDTVIPHFLPEDDFHLGTPDKDDGYLLFIGRPNAGKGQGIAELAAKATFRRLRVVHDGLSGEAKASLIANAHAVLMPTMYLEPFGYVAIEAQMSGTPVITTDWGAFPETVIHGKTGFRCRTAAEFIDAIEASASLDRAAIRQSAVERFGLKAVAPQYERYFRFVWAIHNGDGFFTFGARRDC